MRTRWARLRTIAMVIAGTTAVAAGIVAASQEPTARSAAKPSSAKNTDNKSRPWHITFDELVHNDATGEGEATRVVATSDQDTVIKADLFSWNDKKQTARATGNLHMSDDQAEATADRADIEYARSKRLIALVGNVRITLKPKKPADAAPPPSERQQDGATRSSSDEPALRDYPIEVQCDRVDYEYARERRHAVLSGSLRAVQKLKEHTRTLTAEKAEWFGPEEKVVLYGPVRVEDTKGRKGETPEDVTIYTREGQESIRMRKGVYTMPMEDEDRPSQQPPDRVQSPPTQPSEGKR